MNNMKGEPTTCWCKAVGEIVAQSHHLDMATNWFVIEHEGGAVHIAHRVWVDDDGFRFVEGIR